ncbi:MAG TPA: hypothetical protein VFN94_09205 [Nitrospiria bacterium]|nr:hypothetical protein [Nitrospiria bacterium]
MKRFVIGCLVVQVESVRQALKISTKTDVRIHAEGSVERTVGDIGSPDLRTIGGLLAFDTAS